MSGMKERLKSLDGRRKWNHHPPPMALEAAFQTLKSDSHAARRPLSAAGRSLRVELTVGH